MEPSDRIALWGDDLLDMGRMVGRGEDRDEIGACGGGLGNSAFRERRSSFRPACAPSRPLRHRRQGHEDGVGVAAGHESEAGAPVMEQVEFHVTPAPLQLPLSLFLRPGFPHAPAHQLRIDVEEGQPDPACEGEILLPVAAIQTVEENPPQTAPLAPVGKI